MIRPSQKNSILLVNPWIHDFAAYDFWLKPLGLLYLGSILRARGFEVFLLDCLNLRSLPSKFMAALKTPKRRNFGRGHFYKENIPKPEVLRDIPRQYRRYGVPPDVLKEFLSAFPRPQLILTTSSMTYWYTGLFETIGFLRANIPGVPILLGGTYATLCLDHARRCSGADRVLPGPWDGEKMQVISEYLGDSAPLADEEFLFWPYPAFDLYPRLEYVCLLTRCGCPFSCTYCAVSKLMKDFQSRPPEKVVEEIIYWNVKFGALEFAFYDDALLIDPAGHIMKILQEVIRRGIRCNFHTPNALHIKMIDQEVADLLYRSRFTTIRLGLETSNEQVQIETGGKVNNQEFQRAVRYLRKAGYAGEEIGVYLMAGLPGQRVEEVEESIAFVKEIGAKAILVEYSPIPGTPMFEKAKQMSSFDIQNEPLFHNNSILPCQWEGFTWGDFKRLKEKLRR
ncbi:MAG: radical SAM protein [Deltaproteobacteria bacterium]|nr:radical SAM protein [Deltaproteobacteria bacterium]